MSDIFRVSNFLHNVLCLNNTKIGLQNNRSLVCYEKIDAPIVLGWRLKLLSYALTRTYFSGPSYAANYCFIIASQRSINLWIKSTCQALFITPYIGQQQVAWAPLLDARADCWVLFAPFPEWSKENNSYHHGWGLMVLSLFDEVVGSLE
jgi:hypothetical protein